MKVPIVGFRFSKAQWKRFNNGLSTTAQAIILFAAAAIFVPEAVGLPKDFPEFIAFLFLIYGLILFLIAVILTKNEED